MRAKAERRYLVVARRFNDDVPMSLHTARREAESAARRVTVMDIDDARCRLGWGASCPINVWIVEFLDGKPVESWWIRNL